jgi:hypothetical protein
MITRRGFFSWLLGASVGAAVPPPQKKPAPASPAKKPAVTIIAYSLTAATPGPFTMNLPAVNLPNGWTRTEEVP